VRALLLAYAANDLLVDKDVVQHNALQHVVRFHNARYKEYIDWNVVDVSTGRIDNMCRQMADVILLKILAK
jgi:hypothetical protein